MRCDAAGSGVVSEVDQNYHLVEVGLGCDPTRECVTSTAAWPRFHFLRVDSSDLGISRSRPVSNKARRGMRCGLCRGRFIPSRALALLCYGVRTRTARGTAMWLRSVSRVPAGSTGTAHAALSCTTSPRRARRGRHGRPSAIPAPRTRRQQQHGVRRPEPGDGETRLEPERKRDPESRRSLRPILPAPSADAF
jgi:hypothetical protein